MKLDMQKKLAARTLGISAKRLAFDPAAAAQIKEALTRADIYRLVKRGLISVAAERGISRARARTRAVQKRKGRRAGQGSRKGGLAARRRPKTAWIARVRKQRAYLAALRQAGVIDAPTQRELYAKIKGGLFRSRAHLELFLRTRGTLK